jgi:hypothetical protein
VGPGAHASKDVYSGYCSGMPLRIIRLRQFDFAGSLQKNWASGQLPTCRSLERSFSGGSFGCARSSSTFARLVSHLLFGGSARAFRV